MAWKTGIEKYGPSVGGGDGYGGGGLWDDIRFGGFGDFGGIGIFGGCVGDRPLLKGGGNQWAWKIKTGG